ncbi:MAG TPA: LpqB family beta-propeller domain-containing protein [Actinophytocola sp.]|uniref:LpqB family beta-propeller domain-containing protein n=1 Tax=Actinophytocola sp. TaxID=1872138 RepID=UPI002F943814
MRRSRALVLFLLSVLLVAGCANIPEVSTPHAVRDDKEEPNSTVDGPTKDLDAYDLVREFIHRSGNPEAASLYLTDKGKQGWNGESEPNIILDTFDTVPLRNPGLNEDPGAPSSDVETVVLQVAGVGRLGPDNAFIPRIENREYHVVVRKRNDGQWRIERPPPEIYVPLSDFEASYRAVTVYYFDPDLRVTVPDLRYVAAEPVSGLPARVINVLLSGPSDAMRKSVRSPLDGIGTRTNVVPDPDGTLVVDLKELGDKSAEQREQIATQIVLSLQTVTSSRLRLRADGQDLIPGRRDWRQGDLKVYDAPTKPDSDQPGLVAANGRLHSLHDGKPIEGPAGDGELEVLNGAQSIDGGQLALVVRTDAGPRLRIGPVKGPMQAVNLEGRRMTRPTWLLSTTNEVAAKEVWTVADGDVVRVVRMADGTWKALQVNASELTDFGPITELRLSRDGTRAAFIARGRLGVASVVRDQDSVSLRFPRRLQTLNIVQAVGVDWLSQDTLVVATRQAALPVASLSVDGLKLEVFDRNNLQLPVKSVAAAPDRNVIVTDSAAVSSVPGVGQLWRQVPHGPGPNAIPFYPG